MKPIKVNPLITENLDNSLHSYFKDVNKEKLISQEEELNLAREAKQGNTKARDELIKANLRFVITVAKKYQHRGLPLVDLIQEGNSGLIRAVESFNPDKGYKFISYAVWWIRQAIMKSLSDSSRTIRVPVNQLQTLNKINSISSKFEQKYFRPPNEEELSKEANIDRGKISQSLTAVNIPLSLDTPFRDGSGDSLIDITPDNTATNTDQPLTSSELSKTIGAVLSKLSNRDSDIIRMVFGIGMPPMQYDEIGTRFGIGYERVRQITHSTIKSIKNKYGSKLKEFL